MHPGCYDVVRDAVAAGHPTFGRYWRAEGRVKAERTRRWLAGQGRQMRGALGPEGP